MALIIVAVASNAQFDELPSIENSSELDTRIVGGKSAIIGQFPHQVSLRSSYTKKHFCGGSIITPRFILTAAHCSQGGFASPSNVYAVVGALTRLVGGTVVHLEKITPHQKFNKTILKHDISLIRTATEIIFSRLVRPIALPTKSLPETGDVPVTISGWGLTGVNSMLFFFKLTELSKFFVNFSQSGNSRLPIFLKFGNTDTLNLSECRHQFKEIKLNDNVHDTNVCTKNPVNRGACMGDSGMSYNIY